jgi:MoxR-like ATPase
VVLMDGFDGRDYVIPDDVQVLAAPVLAHRLFPAAQADQVLADLLSVIPLPKQRRP